METSDYYVTFVEINPNHHNMRHLFIFLILLSSTVFISCHPSKEGTADTVVFDLYGNIDAKDSKPLKVHELFYIPLGGDTQEAFFKNANILDVVGDTIVLLEDTPQTSRLIMYSMTNGAYLGQINHRGQGPGEYSSILGAFVDRTNHSVMLPDFHSPNVNVYSLVTDSLVEVIKREYVPTVIEPIGSVESAINIMQPGEDNLKIIQYDGKYALSDSIAIPGYQCGNFSTVWTNAGTNAIIVMGDTIYEILPGKLKQLAVADRGDLTITPEKDMEIIHEIMESGESDLVILHPHMLIRNIQFTDKEMLLTTMHNSKKHSDLYDMSTGNLLYRNTYESLEKPNHIVIENTPTSTLSDAAAKPQSNAIPHSLHVERLFAKDGIWYGIVNEENLPDSDNPVSENQNCALVSFRL